MPADCMLVPAPASARTSPSTAVKLGPCVLCAAPVRQQDTGLFFFLVPSAGTVGSGKSCAKHTHTYLTPPIQNTRSVSSWDLSGHIFLLIRVKECPYLCLGVITLVIMEIIHHCLTSSSLIVKLWLYLELHTHAEYINCLEVVGTTHASMDMR